MITKEEFIKTIEALKEQVLMRATKNFCKSLVMCPTKLDYTSDHY